jgi:hypothetical protein
MNEDDNVEVESGNLGEGSATVGIEVDIPAPVKPPSLVVIYTTTTAARGKGLVIYNAFCADSIEEAGKHLDAISVPDGSIYGVWELSPDSKIALKATEVTEHQPITRKRWSAE